MAVPRDDLIAGAGAMARTMRKRQAAGEASSGGRIDVLVVADVDVDVDGDDDVDLDASP
jgi:hypothetical protein